MNNIIIEKLPNQENQLNRYLIKHTKTVKDINGNDVVIIDETLTEEVTLEGLQSLRNEYIRLMEEIDEKIQFITNLGS